jgi:hypothetical protein
MNTNEGDRSGENLQGYRFLSNIKNMDLNIPSIASNEERLEIQKNCLALMVTRMQLSGYDVVLGPAMTTNLDEIGALASEHMPYQKPTVGLYINKNHNGLTPEKIMENLRPIDELKAVDSVKFQATFQKAKAALPPLNNGFTS